jgi:hypothetical protein
MRPWPPPDHAASIAVGLSIGPLALCSLLNEQCCLLSQSSVICLLSVLQHGVPKGVAIFRRVRVRLDNQVEVFQVNYNGHWSISL